MAVGAGLRSVVRDQLAVSLEPWTICSALPVMVMLPAEPEVRMAFHCPGLLAAGVAMYCDRVELAEKSWLKIVLIDPTPPENVAVTEPLLAPVQLASVAVSDSDGAGGAPTVIDWLDVHRLASRT